jgi:simple sugar transport system permease protein
LSRQSDIAAQPDAAPLTPAGRDELQPRRWREGGLRRVLKLYFEKPALVAFAILIALVVFFSIRTNGLFISAQNVKGIMSLFPELAIVAIGFALLMIAGEFDLSIGSMFGFMPMLVCTLILQGLGFWPAFVFGLLACVVVGLINGAVTIRFGIPSFISTLGMLFMLRSLTVVLYSRGVAPTLPDDAPVWAFSQVLGVIRVSTFWLIGLGAFAYLLLEKTNFGNWVRATGGSLESAQSMGIPTGKVKTACFVICSLFAGLAGMIQVVRLGSPLASLGDGLELQAVAAAVMGGVALYGGVGNVIGALIGMALIRIIDAGMIMSRIDANWFKFAIGALTILAVIANAWLSRVARRIKVDVAK